MRIGAIALCVALVGGAALALPSRAAHEAKAAVDCKALAVPPAAPLPRIATAGIRIGVALGSGSAHGLAHVGVIEALEEAGLEVPVVTGTSAGALVGSLWASGLSGHEIEELLRLSDWDDMTGFAASWQGIYSNDRMRTQLQAVFKQRPIEQWPKRFGAVATNLANGHARVLTTGDGAVAVQASTAVPALFTPVMVNNERLADGALVQPVPVAAARALGASYVLAIDVAYRPYEQAASGISGNAFQAMHILVNNLATSQLRDADFAIRLDLHADLMRCGREALVAEGRDAVRRLWPEIARSITTAAKRQGVP